MVKRLELDGWDVLTIDIKTHGDVFHMQHLTKRYDLVIHAAAQAPHRKAIDENLAAFPYNVALDSYILNWAMRTQQRRFVYLSSCAAYPAWMQAKEVPAHKTRFHEDTLWPAADTTFGMPFDVYGWTKLIGERMAEQAREAGVKMHVVRPFSGYGEDQSFDFPMRAFAKRTLRRENPFVIWGNADQVRDWIHIDDIVGAVMAIVEADDQRTFNLCTGRGVSMIELARMMHQEISYAPVVSVDADAPMGAFYRVGDPSRLHEVYVPQVSLEEGVRRMIPS